MPRSLSQVEVVTLAVYLLGGDSKQIDTEDVAIKANGLAPGRFTWRKHTSQINLELVRVYLSEGKKPKSGGYLVGSGNDGWMLTAKGLAFARRRRSTVSGPLAFRSRTSPADTKRRQHERARMLNEPAFLKFQSGGLDTVSTQEAEAFFRLDDYVTGKARERKLLRALNLFSTDPDLAGAVKALADKVR